MSGVKQFEFELCSRRLRSTPQYRPDEIGRNGYYHLVGLIEGRNVKGVIDSGRMNGISLCVLFVLMLHGRSNGHIVSPYRSTTMTKGVA